MDLTVGLCVAVIIFLTMNCAHCSGSCSDREYRFGLGCGSESDHGSGSGCGYSFCLNYVSGLGSCDDNGSVCNHRSGRNYGPSSGSGCETEGLSALAP